MQEENQERMEGKCFKEGVTNCVLLQFLSLTLKFYICSFYIRGH